MATTNELRNLKSKEQALLDLKEEDFKRITISFYKYVNITDPQEMRDRLYVTLRDLDCLGRIYVAQEGINAQMNVPEHNWEVFDQVIQGIPEFKGIPYKVAREEGDHVSFWKLAIKVKKKIVADGIEDKSFDPSNTGKYMTAQEVNHAIEDPETLVVDMRNRYEAEVGHFEGAHIMQVDTFREQLASVEKELGEQKERKVLMYCTGGIRCEKASAWFKYNGFNDVSHIKGGIIDYDKQVKEQGLENKFKGKNFVFDARMAEKISDDIVATCHVCDSVPADTYYNCKYLGCHVLFIACDGCHETYDGYCCRRCQLMDKLPQGIRKPFIRWKNAWRRTYRPAYKKSRV